VLEPGPSFHEAVIGLAFLLLLSLIAILLAYAERVPTELYVLCGFLLGVEAGIQIPSRTQLTLQVRQYETLAKLAASISPPRVAPTVNRRNIDGSEGPTPGAGH
jgi:hypothetical protein